MTPRPGTLALVLAAALAGGCPPSSRDPVEPSAAVSDNPAAEKAFKRGRDLFEDGRLDEADRELGHLLEAFPRDPLAPAATIYRARVSIARGDYQAALDLLGRMSFESGEDAVAKQARLYKGVAVHHMGRHAEAVELLVGLIGRLTADADRMLLMGRIAYSARELGDLERAVGWFDAYLGLGPPPTDRDAAARALEEACGRITERAPLERLAERLDPGGAAWPLVMARLAWILYDGGDVEGAEAKVLEVRRARRDAEAAVSELAGMIEQRTRVDMGAVGCILPISGRSRLVGEAALRGVMLGARKIRLGKDGHALSVVIRDSEGDPQRAARAVDELVLEENVAAIVGPVDGNAAAAVAARARVHGVPTILLTMREGAQGSSETVFRNFTSVRAEVAALVDTAVRTGSGSFAAMYPDDGYGKAMMAALRKELAARGVSLAVEVSYQPGQTGFSKEAKILAAVEFDALFLPDTGPGLPLIAPALAVEGLWSVPAGEEPAGGEGRGITLLVPSGGMSDDLPRRAGKYLQGAVFTAGYFAGAGTAAMRFADGFASAHGGRPSHYAAYGYDAVILVAGAILDGAPGRQGIARWLARADTDTGERLGLAAPFRGFDSRRESVGPVWTLVLRGDRWELVP